MKAKDNLIVALVCFGLAIFEAITFSTILTHPYMLLLLFTLCGVGGFNFGIGVNKLFK